MIFRASVILSSTMQMIILMAQSCMSIRLDNSCKGLSREPGPRWVLKRDALPKASPCPAPSRWGHRICTGLPRGACKLTSGTSALLGFSCLWNEEFIDLKGSLYLRYYSILALTYLKKPKGMMVNQHIGFQDASNMGAEWCLWRWF